VSRRGAFLVTAGAAVAASVALVLLQRASGPTSRAIDDEGVRAACSGCHAFPPPDVLPRSAWRQQIEHMSFLRDYLPEEAAGSASFPIEAVVAWYEARAPEKLSFERALTRDEPSPLEFRRRRVRLGPGSGPGIATVAKVDPGLFPHLRPQIAAPNMSSGSLHLFSLTRGPFPIGAFGHPVRVAAGDLDRDGRTDLVVSDLGDPMPTEDPLGRVVVARNAGGGVFEPVTLLEGVGRVADARTLDLDGDGDLDIVVGAFGMLRSGGIFVLRNETPPGAGELHFETERVSTRSGAVSVVPFSALDSQPGFAVAFAQHFELVSSFTARAGGFEERVLWRAPHPNWGSSHLAAVDLDGDADLDFLLSHGDTLDDGIAFKPWHGVEWLENRGEAGFVAQRIGGLYGAHAAEAVDLDADGDLDVVACGFLPQVKLPVGRGESRVDSLVWFERRGDEWIPWAIEINHPRHTGLAIVDFDEDGRPDIVAAINRAWDETAVDEGPALEIWLNRGPRVPR
jgi:hypothetical protein